MNNKMIKFAIISMVMILVLGTSTTVFAGGFTSNELLQQKYHKQYTEKYLQYSIFNAAAADVVCGVNVWSEYGNDLTVQDAVLEIVLNLEAAGYSEEADEILSAETLKQSISIADGTIKTLLTKEIENTNINSRKGWFISYFKTSAKEATYASDVIELYIRLQLLLPVGS